MNSFLSVLPSGGWTRLLCDALWQSTVLGAIGWLTARYLVRQSAARAWLLLLTLTACVVVPVASFAARENGLGVFPRAQSTVPFVGDTVLDMAPTEMASDIRVAAAIDHSSSEISQEAVSELVAAAPVAESTVVEAVSNAPRAAEPAAASQSPVLGRSVPAPSALGIVGILWVVASSVLFVRLALGAIATRRVLRRARRCEEEAMLAAASVAAQRMQLKSAPPVMVSDEVRTPMVWALGRVRLLVPRVAEVAGDLDPRLEETRLDWTAAFTHELAHFVRGDGWTRLWAELVCILLPGQPLVWLLRSSFYAACEEACDDWAVASGTDPVDLAETLAAWMNSPRHSATLVAIGMSSSKARTMRLLALREKPVAGLSRGWRSLVVSIAAFLVVGISVMQTRAREDGESSSKEKQSADAKPKATSEKAQGPSSSDHLAADLDKAFADDPLIMLYTRRIQEEKPYLEQSRSDLEAMKSGKKQGDERELRGLEESLKREQEGITLYEEKIKKREAELLQRIRPPQRSVPQAVGPVVAPYVIEPPDILEMTPIRLISKEPVRVEPLDKVTLDVEGTKLDAPIKGQFKVNSSGEVVLGAGYGTVKISDLTRSEAEEAVKTQLEATLANPQVALTIDESRVETGLAGKHLVGPDGAINLGIYGSVKVGGKTVEEARREVEEKLAAWFAHPVVAVDVYAYNSKVFYVIMLNGGGDSILRFPITGNETLLDAVAQVPGLVGLSDAKIWIARPAAHGEKEQVIQINWNDARSGAKAEANPPILPGDRIFIEGARQEQGGMSGGYYQSPKGPKPTSSSSQSAAKEEEKAADDSSVDEVHTVDFGPAVVVKTIPEAGSVEVDPELAEISVTYNREMQDHSWSWCQTSKESFPEGAGEIHYRRDKRTCVMPVKLEPGKTYNIWLNSPDEAEEENFRDASEQSAVPYLLVFRTKKSIERP